MLLSNFFKKPSDTNYTTAILKSLYWSYVSFFKKIFITFFLIYLFRVCGGGAQGYTCYNVEVTGQLAGISFLWLPCSSEV